MREYVSIDLQTPIIGHQGQIHKIILREPTFDEYLSFGDPYNVAYSETGVPFVVENPDVIRRYIDACLVEPKDSALLTQASALVAREVKNKILSFFQPGERVSAGSATSVTSSPSLGTAPTPSSQSRG